MSLRDDITTAIKGRSDIKFDFVRLQQYQDILNQIADQFLTHGTKDLNSIWLWNELLHPTANSQPVDVLATLEHRLVSDELYWFVASEQNGKYWVAEASGSGITQTLREMYHFEYYIVDHKMTWMLCENHHGILVEASAIPSKNMISNNHTIQTTPLTRRD